MRWYTTFWQSYGDTFQKLISMAGSMASLVGVITSLYIPSQQPWSLTAKGFTALCILCVVWFLIAEIKTRRNRTVYGRGDRDGIKRYMHEWVRDGGRVAVWTRDMSWVDDRSTRALLLDKAAKGELILCLPQQTKLSRELEGAGAEVCAYGAELLESPASRFTIAFVGRDGSRVAIGRGDGGMHVIDEFSMGNHPAYYLAADLVELVRARCRETQGRNERHQAMQAEESL